MDLKEISEMPEFIGTIDPLIESKLEEEADRVLARMFSRYEKQVMWLAQTVVAAHNLSVQNARRQEERDRTLRKALWSVAGISLAAIAEEMVRHVAIR